MTFRNSPLGESGVAVLDCEHRTPEAQTSGHPYIAIPDIVAGRVDLATTRRISTADLADWTRRTVPEAGDVLVTRRGRVGDTAVVPDVQCAIGQNLVLLRSDGKELRQDYLLWAARSPQWWAEVDRLRNVGAVFASLNVRDIARIRVPVPSLAGQRAIAEVLGALDDKIAANGRLIAAADRLAEAKTKAAAESSMRVPLREVAVVTMGSSPRGESFNKDGTGTVFYQGVRDFGVRTPTPRVWTDSVSRWARAGDTLLSVRAPVGRVNVADEAVCIGRGLASIRSTTSAPWTLFNLLKAHPELWAPFDAEGTIFSSINRAALEDLAVPAVPSGSATRLEEELTAVELMIAAHDRESSRLAALRDALLPELMSGRLRVKDAARAVEEAV